MTLLDAIRHRGIAILYSPDGLSQVRCYLGVVHLDTFTREVWLPSGERREIDLTNEEIEAARRSNQWQPLPW